MCIILPDVLQRGLTIGDRVNVVGRTVHRRQPHRDCKATYECGWPESRTSEERRGCLYKSSDAAVAGFDQRHVTRHA
jgi:hypothetical protein